MTDFRVSTRFGQMYIPTSNYSRTPLIRINSDDEPSGYAENPDNWIFLTFICPCIANIFSEYNQQDATFLRFIYSCKTLCMFQTGFPSIIRSSKLHIQRQAFVRPLLLPAAGVPRLAAGSSNVLTNA